MGGTQERDGDFDAAKGMLMVLVIFGHLLDQVGWLPSGGMDEASGWAYWVVYSFHMPAFAFVSGWFGCRSDVWRGARKNLYLYAVWQAVYIAFFLAVDGTGSFEGIGLTKPMSHLWYLVSIVSWRIIFETVRPLFEKRPWPCVGIAAAAGMLAGLDLYAGEALSWSRTVVLLPFYLAGAACRGSGLHPARIMAGMGRKRHLVWTGGLASAVLFAGFFGHMPLVPTSVLYCDGPYLLFDWVLPRGCMYAVAALMTVGLFALAPFMGGAVRRIGRMSMHAYLAHMIPVTLLGKLCAVLFPDGAPGILLPFGAAVLAMPVALLCVSRPAVYLMRPLAVPPWARHIGNGHLPGKEA